MLLTNSTSPLAFSAGSSDGQSVGFFTRRGTSRSYSNSTSLHSSITSLEPLRLSDVAKQFGMGVHVENWREDTLPVRQYLPLQHIIGSLKRDRDEQVSFITKDNEAWKRPIPPTRPTHTPNPESPASDDSFLDVLRSPKRRRTSECSRTSQRTTDSDPDRRFSYQAAEHVAKDIPTSALPGLNHIINLATITADERDIFAEYAPKHLDDPQLLMNEVLQLRRQMTIDEEPLDDFLEMDDMDDILEIKSPIVPLERDAEVRRAFENFPDLNTNRYIANI